MRETVQANATATAAERDPGSANAVVVRLRADHVRVNLIWFDGGEITAVHDTTEGAMDHLAALGYAPWSAQ